MSAKRRSITILLLSMGVLAAAPGCANWQLASPTQSPPAFRFHEMAYLAPGEVLLFGGATSTHDQSNDTWIYDRDADTWQQTATTGPQPIGRRAHALAHIGEGKVLLFGGSRPGHTFGDTWVYSRSTGEWERRARKKTAPAPRNSTAMAYVGGDRVVLYGGNSRQHLLADEDTWIYDLSDDTWTQKHPDFPPGPLHRHQMAHLGGDRAVVHGGLIEWQGSGPTEKAPWTWVYDAGANTWSVFKIPGPGPRIGHAMTFASLGKATLFGGTRFPAEGVPNDPGGDDDGTWKFTLNDGYGRWAIDDDNDGDPTPSARSWMGLARSSPDGSSFLVLFGGTEGAGPAPIETWLYGSRPGSAPGD